VHDGDGWIGRVDFSRANVVIEVVGKKWHVPRVDPDSHRYTRLSAAGFRLLLFTFTDIEHRPDHVIGATRAARAADPAA
jgi:very-short-patch-repair endonuclease